MTWPPIYCNYCHSWHEQPDAAKTSRLCREYCMTHKVRRAPRVQDLPENWIDVLSGFPELSKVVK